MATNTELLDLEGLTYYDELIKEYIKTADVGTVNGHTVAVNVPADAKFTDTTYENVTDEASGLMSPAQKARLEQVTRVEINSDQTTGTKLATITIDDVPTDIYAPEATLVTEETVAGWGFTKNQGTVTGITLGEESKAVVDGVVTLPAYPTTLPASDVKAWAKADEKPTYTAEEIGTYTKAEIEGLIPDVSNFITNAANDLVNYYLKTETYTQAEVNALVSAIPKFAIAVVDSLPTEEISTTTIYLLKTSETETGNLYTEYIYVNGNWETLGTQKLDLSGYATKAELATVATSGSFDDLVDVKRITKSEILALFGKTEEQE